MHAAQKSFQNPETLADELSACFEKVWAGLVYLVLRPGILSLLSPRLEGRKDDLQFLQALVESKGFHSLIKVSYQPTFGGTSTLSLTPLSLHIIPI